MKVKTNWDSIPSFENAYPEKWEWLKKLLSRLDCADTCLVGGEAHGTRIWITLFDREEPLGSIDYPVKTLHGLTYHDIEKDLIGISQCPRGTAKKLIQIIYDEFKSKNEWPNSREMSVKTKDLGNYYRIVKHANRDYLRGGEEHDVKATTRLSIRGVSICDRSDDDLNLFIKVLKVFYDTYNSSPKDPKVRMRALSESGRFAHAQIIRISLLLREEGHLYTQAHYSEDGEHVFTVAPSILEFQEVETISEYFRAQNSFTDNMGHMTKPVGVLEMANGGDAATKQTTEKNYIYDLFISYSTRDSKAARKINDTAEANGLTCFLAEKDLKGGDEWADRIREALNTSSEVVILITPNSIKSPWVQRELTAAWVLYKRSTPILLNCTEKALPDLIAPKQYRKFRNIEKFCKEVLERKNEPQTHPHLRPA